MSDHAGRKILFIIRALNIGGAERQIVELAGGLKRAGWDVKLATFYAGGAFEQLLAEYGVPHVSLGKRGRWDVFPFLYRLLKLIHNDRPDVVYSMLTMSNVLVGLLRPLLGRTRIVWGVAASNMDLSYYDWLARVESALEVRLANRADLIVCNSFAGRNHHVERGYPGARTVVVCNGIDTDCFRPDENARREVRSEWGVAPDEILIGLVGRLDPIKGHPDFLAAATRVAAVRSDVRFACIGDGAPEYRERMIAIAAELGIADRVLWVTERTEVWRLYNALDLLVSSSLSEGLANVICEAMATGVACVATAVGDSARVIDDPRRIVPPRDSTALSAAILDAIREPGFDPAASRQRIVSGYSVAALVEHTVLHLSRLQPALPRTSARASRAAREDGAAPSIVLVARRLDIGGAERQLVELAKGLHAAGWDVTVATFYPGGALASHLQDSGVEAVSLDKRGRWDVAGFLWRLLVLLRTRRPDVVHGYLNTPNVLLALLRPFIGSARIVWGVRASNMDLRDYDRLAAVEFRLARSLVRYADLVICNSEAGRAYHVTQGYPAERMVVVPNGVDVGKFAPDAAARRQVRTEWGIGPGHVLVGNVARLDPMKDHRNFLRAAARVAEKRPEVRFVCVGDGPAAYRNGLFEDARALGLGSRVIWTGALEDVARVYNALDVCVLASSYGEGFPNTVLEAMATGIPCVVTDVGDSAAIVQSLGWVCPPRDSDALAAAILSAVDAPHPDAARIREHVESTYAAPLLIERTVAQLAKLTACGVPTPHAVMRGTSEY